VELPRNRYGDAGTVPPNLIGQLAEIRHSEYGLGNAGGRDVYHPRKYIRQVECLWSVFGRLVSTRSNRDEWTATFLYDRGLFLGHNRNLGSVLGIFRHVAIRCVQWQHVYGDVRGDILWTGTASLSTEPLAGFKLQNWDTRPFPQTARTY
jgi:hypothetical protein